MKDLCYNPKKTCLLSGHQILCFNQINHTNVIVTIVTTTLSTNNIPIVEHQDQGRCHEDFVFEGGEGGGGDLNLRCYTLEVKGKCADHFATEAPIYE
jgi:hypothetical protein